MVTYEMHYAGTTFTMKMNPNDIILHDNIFSPTHKRTEGRAPVWGSEFTSKRRRTTRGDPAETAVG